MVVDFTLEQLQSGDREAWRRAYDCLSVLILSVLQARSTSVSWPELEDISIDTVAKLVEGIAGVTGGVEGLKKLAITIALNQLRDRLDAQKAQKRGAGKVESLDAQPPGLDYKSEGTTPDQDAEAAERAFLLNEALEEIPERYRDVLKDAYFLGLKQREIAAKRSLSIGSVGVYLDRGLVALRPLVEKYGLDVTKATGVPLSKK
jgi:RNA polymerase sigma factor (sigma-70 family)